MLKIVTIFITFSFWFTTSTHAFQCRAFLTPDYKTNPLVKVVKSQESFRVEEESKKGPFFESDFFFNAFLEDDKSVSIDALLKQDGLRSTSLSGQTLFHDMIKHFGPENIKTIIGAWFNYSDNFHAYNEAILQGHPPSKAALLTWTGKQAAKHGFKFATVTLAKVNSLESHYDSYQVIFSKSPKDRSDTVEVVYDDDHDLEF